MRATLSKTKFKDAPIVPVAAKPANSAEDKENGPIGQYFEQRTLLVMVESCFHFCDVISVYN